jgi:NAD(P)-dependent dehydrogenase (short-subunit alcohol dehydrogenase family)
MVNDAGVTTTGSGADPGPAASVVDEILALGGLGAADSSNVAREPHRAVENTVDVFHRLDIVVNNAGTFTHPTAFADTSEADFDAVVGVHLGGSSGILRAAWPHLVASGSGRVVNISSAGVWGEFGMAAYSAAKAAIIGLTRVLALEGRVTNVNVNAVMPHGLTRMLAQLPDDNPIKHKIKTSFPEDAIAPFVAWLVHQDTKISGETFAVGGGRAARVVLAEMRGVMPPQNTPEAWHRCVDDLMAVGDVVLPSTAGDEMNIAIEHIMSSKAAASA